MAVPGLQGDMEVWPAIREHRGSGRPILKANT